MKLPLKTRILQYAIGLGKDFTTHNVVQALEPEYRGEALFTGKQVGDYVDSYLGVGFFTAVKEEYDSKGELIIHCKVTDYGKTRGQYIR